MFSKRDCLRDFALFVILVLMALCLVSCASSKMANGSTESSFVKQFTDLGVYVRVKEGNLALQSDVVLPQDASLVLDTNEIWVLNLNGHTISKAGQGPAVDVVKGLLGIVNGASDPNQGGVSCSNDVAVVVRKGATLQVDNGTITGKDYAIEVCSGGYLKVTGGRIQANVLPILGQQGWGGNFIGGLFSCYDEAYDQVILGKNYACIRFDKSDADFTDTWSNAFTIAQKTEYGGVSGLKLNCTSGFVTRFRMYRTYLTDALVQTEDVVPAYEWTMYPGQSKEVFFDSGSYVLKVAEGYDWDDESGFGADGYYWCMEPYAFADTLVYSISTGGPRESHITDTLEGFLTGTI